MKGRNSLAFGSVVSIFWFKTRDRARELSKAFLTLRTLLNFLFALWCLIFLMLTAICLLL